MASKLPPLAAAAVKGPVVVKPFPKDSWVQLKYDGPTLIGQVHEDLVTLNGTRFITFRVPGDVHYYTVPVDLVEPVLDPALEDLAQVVLGEYLNTTDLTIVDARDIVLRIATVITDRLEKDPDA